MATIVEQAKAQMAKSVESTKENFSGIRTGRANPALLNGITVDYYGAPTPLKAVATIGVPEPRTLSVTPFDASQANAVEKALRDSDLGASPRRDGQRHSPDHAGADRGTSQGICQTRQGQGGRWQGRSAQHPTQGQGIP